MGLGEAVEEAELSALAAAQGADGADAFGAGVLGGLGDGAGEDGVRAGFDEDPVAGGEQGGEGGVETHRLTEVGEPVGGVHGRRVDGFTRHRGDQRR